jgi:hypothetical protein
MAPERSQLLNCSVQQAKNAENEHKRFPQSFPPAVSSAVGCFPSFGPEPVGTHQKVNSLLHECTEAEP